MIRYIYSACFLMGGVGLPLLAKDGTASASKGTKAVCLASAPQPAVQPAKPAPVKTQPTHVEPFLVITPRLEHPEVSYTLISRQMPGASAAKGKPGTGYQGTTPVTNHADADEAAANGRLARVTAYWPCEGDYYTRQSIAATGVRLHDGHCAVDPNIIPYGSVVDITGVGKFLAVDTGSAVVSRTAAREAGHTSAERGALVIDLFFEDRDAGERFASRDAKWTSVSWWTPTATDTKAKAARGLFAEEDWTKIQNKQL